MISTFLGYQLYGNNVAQSLKRTAAEPAVNKDQAYYNANIGKVKTVKDLVGNYRLLSYATKAFGLSDMTYATNLLTKVLESDLTSSKSLANSLKDSRYTAFAQAFNFKTDGTLATPLQSTSQQSLTEALFKANTTLNAAGAATATKSFETAMNSISSLDQLEKNPAALGYVLIAYGIDPSAAASTFEQTLESDLTNPSGFLSQKAGNGYLALSQAFNVSTDGSRSTTLEAQTQAAIDATTAAYMNTAGTTTAAQKAATTETTYYLSKIHDALVTTDITNDSRLLAYIKKAYALPSSATVDTITKALTSDTTDVKTNLSYAKTSAYPSYLALAKAFNFTATGKAGAVQFQSDAQTQSTVQLYMKRQTSDSTAAAAASTYYTANIGSVQTVSDLESDPKLLSFLKTAYGLDASTPAATITAILTRAKSVDTGYLALTQAFSVQSNGAATALPVAQTDTATSAATAAYMATADSTTASQRAASKETTYYLSQIGSVATASDLVADSRLVSYIKLAYKLPVSATAATIQQALTSDKTDPASFANTAGGAYATLAKAFQFGTDGTAATLTQVQSNAQQKATIQAFTQRGLADAKTTASATAYYTANIGKVQTVAALESDPKLMAYVLGAYGLDPATPAATVSALLQNTNSLATNFQTLANNFSVNGDGSAVTTPAPVQTAANVTATTNAYMATIGTDPDAQTAAATETTYYQTVIAGNPTVPQLLGDSRIRAYLTAAYGLPATATSSDLSQVLASDPTNKASFAATSGKASYANLAAAFNYTAAGTTLVQTAAQQQTTAQAFAANTMDDATTAAAATAYYNATIGTMTSVADIQADPKMLTYLSTAFGVDLSTDTATIGNVLESTHNILGTTKNASLLALNLAFNVDGTGSATAASTAESTKNITATTTAYLANAASDTASQAAAKTATAYFKSAIANVTSVSSLLADPKLVAYIKQAYAIPKTVSTDTLRKVLTSNVQDKKSVANTLGTNYEQLAAAFEFKSTGLIAPAPQQAQSKAQLDAINAAYIEQQMETEAGAQNPGIALALYLQANAAKVTDAYSILADKKLTKVFQVLLGLPATASAADIDAQAKTITNQFNLLDLKNPKKVSALIQRFSILYDLNPPTSTAPSTTTSLFSGTTDAQDVTSLFGTSSS